MINRPKGAMAYLDLADEILERNKHGKNKGLGRGLDALLSNDEKTIEITVLESCHIENLKRENINLEVI